jgi:hypothetical protein
MTDSTKIKFYNVLTGKTSLKDFETWIYSDSDLESEIGTSNYMDLVSFGFNDKNANEKINSIIGNIINNGDFERWKITNKLIDFIDHPEKTKELLNDFYHLFCGFPNENPYEAKGYKFLQNLGLNYLYWIDETYLKTSYGDKWIDYYKKYENEVPLYHQQLVPVAKLILSGLQTNRIEILEKGIYKISASLKAQLESDKILQLKHKD